MADYGMLGAIGEGLKQGLMTYQQVKQAKDQRDLQNQAMQSALLERGQKIDPDTGTIQEMPMSPGVQTAVKGMLGGYGVQTPDDSNYTRQDVKDLSTWVPKYGGYEASMARAASGAQLGRDRLDESKRYHDMTGGMAQQRLGISEARLGNQTDAQAMRAGDKYTQDSVMKNVTNTLNSLNRADKMLSGDVPITASSFNILQQDLINATAPGGAATEGKVNREMVHSYAGLLNELQTKFGDVEDMRQEPGAMALVKQLKDLSAQMRTEYQSAQANRSDELGSSYGSVSNPKVQSTVQAAKKRYGGGLVGYPGGGLLQKESPASNQESHPQDSVAIQWAKQNPGDPRSKAILDANGIK